MSWHTPLESPTASWNTEVMSWHTPVESATEDWNTVVNTEVTPRNHIVPTVDQSSSNDSPSSSPIGGIRVVDIKKLMSKTPQPYLLNVNGVEAAPAGKIDEYEAIGVNFAAKLRRMDPTQQIHAELLINKVLALGLQHQLSTDFDIAHYQHI